MKVKSTRKKITIEFNDLQVYTLSSIIASFFEMARILDAKIPDEFRQVSGSIILTMKDALDEHEWKEREKN